MEGFLLTRFVQDSQKHKSTDSLKLLVVPWQRGKRLKGISNKQRKCGITKSAFVARTAEHQTDKNSAAKRGDLYCKCRALIIGNSRREHETNKASIFPLEKAKHVYDVLCLKTEKLVENEKRF